MKYLEKAEQYIREEVKNLIKAEYNDAYIQGYKEGAKEFADFLDSQEKSEFSQSPEEICNHIVQSTIMGDIKCVNKKPCFLHDIPKETNPKDHEHYFEFSHCETESNPSSTAKIGNIRIFICRTCGMVIKSLT